ncbi:MAG: TetR/AcrR family transcriptional regulator [Candidatus Onthomonas sp.]
MYQGDNPIALQSQSWLTDALLALMEEKPFEKISVADICRRADLSRQTFYHCFSSKEEILRRLLQRQYQAQLRRLLALPEIGLEDAVFAFATVLSDNRALLQTMARHHLESLILSEITACIQLFAQLFAAPRPEPEQSFAVAFLSGALANTLLCWLKTGEPFSPAELAGLIRRFLSGSYYSFCCSGPVTQTFKQT